MEVEPELFRQIEEEFQTPPIPTNLIYSPATDRGTWESNKSSTEEDDAPDYSMEGLLPGGLLPATTYQPPEIEEKRKAKPCIYSPSIYSNNDVFRVSLHLVLPHNYLPHLLPLSSISLHPPSPFILHLPSSSISLHPPCMSILPFLP